jgi:hypothetical protein
LNSYVLTANIQNLSPTSNDSSCMTKLGAVATFVFEITPHD